MRNVLVVRCGRTGQKMLECVRREVRERADDQIGVEVLRRMTADDTYAAHASPTRGLHPGRCILDDDGPPRRNPQPRGGREENLRVWLATVDVLFANDGVKGVTQMGAIEDALDMGVRRRGGDGLFPPRRTQSRYPSRNSRQWRELSGQYPLPKIGLF